MQVEGEDQATPNGEARTLCLQGSWHPSIDSMAHRSTRQKAGSSGALACPSASLVKEAGISL